MAAASSSSPRQAMDTSNTLDAAAALGLADDGAMKSRILGYVDFIEGMQVRRSKRCCCCCSAD